MKPLAKSGRIINLILKKSRLFAFLPALFVLAVRSSGQCIPMDMAFSYTPPNECINQTPVLKLNYIPMGSIPSEDGIYPGTKYFIDWGDGKTVTWVSTAAERIPPTSVRWHEYKGPSNCIYEMTSTVTSPCNPAYVKNFGTRVVIHGRDITEDGDGNLLIQENGTDVTQTIRVCQGTTHLITLKDASTWNCQNPIWPDNTEAPKNDSPRTIQWIYGEDNGGTVWNNIGTTVNPSAPDAVMIDGSQPATISNGYTGSPVVNITSTGQLSRSILIPASCRKDEYFDVYLLGWNKCNPYPGSTPVYTHIRILVVDAPAMPIASNKNICAGGDPTLTAVQGSPAGDVLTWYSNPDKTGALGTGNTFIPSVSAPGTYKYYVASGQASGDLCSGPAREVTLTINPRAGISQQPVTASVCEGEDATFTVTAGVAAPSAITSYQWQRRSGSGVYTNITSTTDGGIYTDFGSPTLKINNAPYLIDKYTYQCRITTTGGCTVTSSNKAITVNRYPVIKEHPSDKSVCETYNTVFTVTDDNSIAVTGRQWQVSMNGGTTWTDLSNGGGYAGTTSANLSVSNVPLTFNGNKYRCILTTAGMCSVTSNSGRLIVNPLPDVTITGSSVSDPVICSGQTSVIILSNSVSGVSYQLQLESDGSNIGVPVTGNGGNITFSVAPPVTTTYKIKAGIISSGCLKDVNDRSMVTVNPLPDPSITGDNNVCANTGGVIYAANDEGGRTFLWEISGGSINSGQGSNTVSVTWGAAGSGWVRVNEKITATGCEKISANYNVTINPGPPSAIPEPVSGSTSICRNGTLVTDVTDVATAAQYIWDYSWVDGTNNAVTPGSLNSIDLTGLAPGTYTISVAGSNGCGTGDFMNPGHSFTIFDIPDLSPLAGAVCSDEASGILLSVSNPDPFYCTGISYNITAINSNGLSYYAGSPATGNGFDASEIADDAWTNLTGSDVNVIYTVVPVNINGCQGNEEQVVISVKSKPAGGNASLKLCSGSAVNYDLQANINSLGNGLTSTYIWNAPDNPDVNGETTGIQSAGTINDVLINTTASSQVVQYTILPTGLNLCQGWSFTLSVTVDPEPVLSQADASICSDAATGIVLSDLNNIPASFEIISITPQSGLIAGSGNSAPGTGLSPEAISNDKWTNLSSGPLTVTYSVIPASVMGCRGSQKDIVVSVNPEPALSELDKTVCDNSASGIVLSDLYGLSDGFNLISVTPEAGLTDGADNALPATGKSSGYILNDTWKNNSDHALTVTYVVVPVINGICTGDPENITLTVYPPVFAGAIAGSTAVCYNTDAPVLNGETPASGGSGIINYSWYQTGNLAAVPGDNNWTLIEGASGSGFDPGIIKEPVKFVRKARDGSCGAGAYSNVVTIMVKPLPVTASIRGEDKLCDNATDRIYQVTNNPGSTYAWIVPNSILEVTFNAGLYFVVVNAKSGTPGSGQIQVIETDHETGCIGEPVKFDITVSPVLPGGEITGPGAVCQGDAGILYSVPEVAGSVYSWTLPAGASISNDPRGHEIIVNFSQPLTGMISVVETTPGGCTTVHTPKTIKVSELPVIYDFTAPAIYCEGESGVTATLSGSQTGVIYQLFRENDGVGEPKTGTGQPIAWNGITAGTYLIRASASSSSCLREMSGTVVIAVKPLPVITLEPSVKEVCENGGPISFIAKASGMIDSLRWQVNNGTAWSDIHDGGIYSGSASSQLSLRNIPASLNGYRYRMSVKGRCSVIYSEDAALTVNLNPVVKFTSDTINACGGVAVQLNGNPESGSGAWASHLWTGDTGPLNDRSIQAPVFTGKTEGTYFINYRVKDTKGCFGEKGITIIVDSPDAEFVQDILTGCAPLEVRFSKDLTGLTRFWWDFGDGSPLDTISKEPVHTYIKTNPISTEYITPKLTVQSQAGCRSTYISIVTLYPQSDATFIADKMIVCSGEPVSFTAARGATKYYWDFGDGITAYSPGESNTHVYTNFTSEPSEYKVKLLTTSFYGCTGENEIMIKVLPSPGPVFSAYPASQAFDISGNEVSFKNETGAGSLNYLWLFGDGGTSWQTDPVHTYAGTGTFKVILVARNEACSDSITHEIIIVPQSPVADFDSIPAGCEPLDVRIINSTLNADIPGTTWLWTFGDGAQSTAREPLHTFFNAGTYRVELTVKGPGGISYSSKVVTVYPSPRANFDLAPNVVFVNDENVRMFNLSKGAVSYLWEFGDGDTSTLKEPMHKYMKEGVYDVSLHTGSDNGCTSTYIMSPAVTVKPAGELRFSTVFIPNKEGAIERTDLPTGGIEIDQFFFPPVREEVHNYKLQIFNRQGMLVFESRDINIPWNGYHKGKLCPQGVYVWYVEGKYATGKPFRKVGDITLLH